MTPKLCRYQCGVMLDAWDEEARKYREAGSGGLHTKERCEEAKAKLRTVQGEQNNHGNELVQSLPPQQQPQYVDHTQPAKLKLKILTDPTPEGLALTYNIFGESHKIQFSQYHPVNALYTIAIFFEEIKQ